MSLELKYFVLKPRSKFHGDLYASASRAAILTYAQVIRKIDIKLSNDLIDWAGNEKIRDLEMKIPGDQ